MSLGPDSVTASLVRWGWLLLRLKLSWLGFHDIVLSWFPNKEEREEKRKRQNGKWLRVGPLEAEPMAGLRCPEWRWRALRMGRVRQAAQRRSWEGCDLEQRLCLIPWGALEHELHQKVVPPGRRKPALCASVSQGPEPQLGQEEGGAGLVGQPLFSGWQVCRESGSCESSAPNTHGRWDDLQLQQKKGREDRGKEGSKGAFSDHQSSFLEATTILLLQSSLKPNQV